MLTLMQSKFRFRVPKTEDDVHVNVKEVVKGDFEVDAIVRGANGNGIQFNLKGRKKVM